MVMGVEGGRLSEYLIEGNGENIGEGIGDITMRQRLLVTHFLAQAFYIEVYNQTHSQKKNNNHQQDPIHKQEPPFR